MRVEYLGASVRRVNGTQLRHCGRARRRRRRAVGALARPHRSRLRFWTTSGEFVFVAILARLASVTAVFVAAVLLEFVRSFSSQYFPNTWQGALGVFLLLVILFLPRGIGSLVRRRGRAREAGASAVGQRRMTALLRNRRPAKSASARSSPPATSRSRCGAASGSA